MRSPLSESSYLEGKQRTCSANIFQRGPVDFRALPPVFPAHPCYTDLKRRGGECWSQPTLRLFPHQLSYLYSVRVLFTIRFLLCVNSGRRKVGSVVCLSIPFSRFLQHNLRARTKNNESTRQRKKRSPKTREQAIYIVYTVYTGGKRGKKIKAYGLHNIKTIPKT